MTHLQPILSPLGQTASGWNVSGWEVPGWSLSGWEAVPGERRQVSDSVGNLVKLAMKLEMKLAAEAEWTWCLRSMEWTSGGSGLEGMFNVFHVISKRNQLMARARRSACLTRVGC